MVIGLIFTASSVSAAETWKTSTVSRLMPLSTGEIVVSIADDAAACTNVNVPKRYLLAVGGTMTADGLKNIYASLLYAAASDKQVTLYFDDASSSCTVTRVWVIN
jgi:hypothetical protein